MRKSLRCAAVAMVAFAFGESLLADSAPFPIQAVAYFGQEAPGTSGARFDVFDDFPMITQDGRIAFTARLQGTGSLSGSNNRGLWFGPVAGLTAVALQTLPVPYPPQDRVWRDASRFTFDLAPSGALEWNGISVAFQGSPDSRGDFFLEQSGSFSRLISSGDPAPGVPGAVLQSAGSFATHPNGQYAFDGGLRIGTGGVTSSNDHVLWANLNGTTTVIARTGSAAAGSVSGATWDSFLQPSLTADSEVLFFGIRSDGVGLWSSNGTITTPVALNAQQVPGAALGVKFGRIAPQQVHPNSSGKFAFLEESRAIWTKEDSQYRKIVGIGSLAPGGSTFNALYTNPHITDDGRVIFGAIAGSTDGIYAGNESGFTLIAEVGAQVPHLPAGTTFSTIHPPAVNSDGLVAFIADLRDPEGDLLYNYLFATDYTGEIQMLTDRVIDLEGGESLQIKQASLYAQTFGDVEQMQFNDAGQLVFAAELPNFKNAVFVAQIPEPDSTSMLALALLGLSLWRMPRA
jgi:hypothetical protein